jgi:hypothetical protein
MVHAIQVILIGEHTSANVTVASPLLLLLKIYNDGTLVVFHNNDMN